MNFFENFKFTLQQLLKQPELYPLRKMDLKQIYLPSVSKNKEKHKKLLLTDPVTKLLKMISEDKMTEIQSNVLKKRA